MPPEAFTVYNATKQVAVAGRVVIAATSRARRKGLLGQSVLMPGSGLLLSPCNAIHTFWMRFAIDTVFLSRERQVVKLVRALQPWRIAVCPRAHSVLELEAGAIDRSGLEPGDCLRFQTE